MAEDGGEAACWLHELCSECGAVPEGEGDRCWRCGAALHPVERDSTEARPERP